MQGVGVGLREQVNGPDKLIPFTSKRSCCLFLPTYECGKLLLIHLLGANRVVQYCEKERKKQIKKKETKKMKHN